MNLISNCLIAGKWCDSANGKTFEVTNPFNNNVIANVASCNEQQVVEAIDAANLAYKTWGQTLGKERGIILRKLYNLMIENRDLLAKTITLENGKALAESYGEVDYANSFVEWFSEEAKRIYGDIIPSIQYDQKLFVFKESIGVVGIITPWNFPLAMLVRKASAALAAGCTIVIKPSSLTPLSALLFGKLCQEAGFPPSVVNIVCGESGMIGNVLSNDPKVKMLTFTGSTDVGKMLMASASSTVKKVVLELGGNAPLIIFDDANIEKAVEGVFLSKLRGGGQSCVSANRIYVAKSLLKEFLAKLISKFELIKLGDGMNPDVNMGPLINEAAVKKIDDLINDAVTNYNAEIVYKGNISHLNSNCFYAPTIILTHDANSKIESTEIFGPVASIFTFEDEHEVIERSNNTNYGLASYFYSENKDKINQVMRNLEYGMIGINDVAISSEVACFGGVKESGLGREGGKEGIKEYLEDKFVVVR